MITAVLSPHLDDAVLSCWHLLAGPGDVTVINIFAGSPPAGTAPPWWDRLTGAADPVARMRERVREDARALGRAGRAAVNLGFLDEQYRDGEQAVTPLVEELRRRLEPGARVCAPAALGDHPDHALVRAAALELWRGGAAVALYADVPHAIPQGWPAWVVGDTSRRDDPTAAAWERALGATGIAPAELTSTVNMLDAAAHAAKLEAAAIYGTQLAGLVAYGFQPLTEGDALRYEVLWTLPSAVRGEHLLAHGAAQGLVGEPGADALDDRLGQRQL